MKNFSRTYLVDVIKYNGEKFTYQPTEVNNPTKKHVCINVLSKNLKGKTDLFGQPYKATKFIYSN